MGTMQVRKMIRVAVAVGVVAVAVAVAVVVVVAVILPDIEVMRMEILPSVVVVVVILPYIGVHPSVVDMMVRRLVDMLVVVEIPFVVGLMARPLVDMMVVVILPYIGVHPSVVEMMVRRLVDTLVVVVLPYIVHPGIVVVVVVVVMMNLLYLVGEVGFRRIVVVLRPFVAAEHSKLVMIDVASMDSAFVVAVRIEVHLWVVVHREVGIVEMYV